MIHYKEIWLVTKEEFKKAYNKEAYNNAIINGLFVDTEHLSLADLAKTIDLDNKGAFDYAVPQGWFDEHQNEWRNDWTMRAVWFYPYDSKEAGHTMGKPLRIWEMFEMLKQQIYQEALELWIAHQLKI